jgi:hypothetical protein
MDIFSSQKNANYKKKKAMCVATVAHLNKPEGKKTLERPRYRWEDNIKMDLREIELEGVDWIHLAQDRN